jgi:choline dehydrogenase-like flavoprotein
VVAEAPLGGGRVRRLTIRARATVLACGAYGTPALLLRNRLATRSGHLGRHLTVHPATAMLAEFDEPIDSWNAIPQGYHVGDLADRGIRYEGGSMPLELTAAACSFIGPEYTRLMERFNHLAPFGFMVEDTSTGRVVLGPGGRPLVLYNLNDADRRRVHEGLVLLARIFLAAGASLVVTPVAGQERLTSEADVRTFERRGFKAADLTLTGFHPLGTARLGRDPRASVVGPDHQCHEVPDLYVIDGSSVPSSLGVNPQVTIMAMATRAARRLAERLGG